MSKISEADRLKARSLNGMTVSFQDLRSAEKDPKGQYVQEPAHKSKTDLMKARSRYDSKKIVHMTAEGIE